MTTIVRRRATNAPPVSFSEDAASGVRAPARTRTVRPSATLSEPLTREELLTAIQRQMMTAQMVADHSGIAVRSVSIYHTVEPYRMPKPDIFLGRTPLWWRETIENWDATRPKQRGRVKV